MQAFLRAYANAWAEAGAGDLAGLVNAVAKPLPAISAQIGVPAALASDFDHAVASSTAFRQLQRELVQIGSLLPWMQGAMKMPDSFQDRYSYVELAGPRGMITSSEISFGLYLQQRNVVYPSHWHAAAEDYLIVSGTALWQIGNGDFAARPPGSHIRHLSNQPHATTTLEEPVLAMWFWQGDIRASTYRIVGVDV